MHSMMTATARTTTGRTWSCAAKPALPAEMGDVFPRKQAAAGEAIPETATTQAEAEVPEGWAALEDLAVLEHLAAAEDLAAREE